MGYLSPVVPQIAAKSGEYLNAPFDSSSSNDIWQDISIPLLDHQINPYQHLAQRLDHKTINKMLLASKEANKLAQSPSTITPEEHHLSIDDFLKMDLQVVWALL